MTNAFDAMLRLISGGEKHFLEGDIDVPEYAALLRRHRVTYLAAQRWSELHAQGKAPPMPLEIAAEAERAHRRSLACTAFLLELAAALDEAGVRWMPLKGPALSQAIYGDATMRTSRDIDLLVEPAQMEAAVACARRLGWAIADDWQRAARLTGKVDLELRPTRPGQPILELHSDVAGGRAEIDWGLDAACGTLMLGGRHLPWPDRRSLTAYVAWHGGRHFWFRLNWLVDLAILLGQEEDGSALLHRAQAMGAELSLRAGCILVERLLHHPPLRLPTAGRAMERRSRRLAAWAERRIRLDVDAREVARPPWSFVWTLREWRTNDRPLRRLAAAMMSLARPREPDARRLGLGLPLAAHVAARPFFLAGRLIKGD